MRRVYAYSFTILGFSVFFWFYFQLTTYSYKVDRWFQPLEAELISLFAKNCSPKNSWLSLVVHHAVHLHGGYSAQVAFLDGSFIQEHCEIGYQNQFLGPQVNELSRYRYASVTKLVTAATILDLVIHKKIKLSDSLVSFFPEFTEFKDDRVRTITIEHLLNHSAGLNRLTLNGDSMFMRNKKPWCPYDLSQLQSIRLSTSPGSQKNYSNEGFCLLGEVVSRVTGESFKQLAERKFSLSSRNIKFISNHYYEDEVRYDYRYEEWYDDSYLELFDFEALASTAGLSGSAVSLAELLRDLNQESLISKASLAKNNCKLQKDLDCVELGVFYYGPFPHGIKLLYHGGYLPGVAALAITDSFGGITVLLKSGADRYQENPDNQWVPWIYKRLTLYYVLQGKLPILNQMLRSSLESE